MAKAFQAEFVSEGILKIVFDMPGSRVNLFNAEVAFELDQLIEELKNDSSIKAAYLVSGKANHFIAGADINQLAKIASSEEAYKRSRQGQELFERWANLPFPTLAVIDGACMGGGTEWVLAFTYRFATNDIHTKVGLPEVKLGLIPGWGGTVRLPRLIGMRNALQLILPGNPVNVGKAYRMGLVDELIPPGIIDQTAVDFLRRILREGDKVLRIRRRRNPGRRGLLERTTPGHNIIVKKARRKVLRETGGRYPAPLEALKAVRFSRENDFDDSLIFEARKFAVLMASEVSKNLLSVFFITEEVKKSPRAAAAVSSPGTFARIGVIGAGVIGRGIAQLAAEHDLPVRLADVKSTQLAGALAHCQKLFDQQVTRGTISARLAERKMDLISPTTEYRGFTRLDLLVEAVPEDPALKAEVLKQLDKQTPPATVIVSTTDTIAITTLERSLQRPDHFAGFHCFNPVHRIPLVEIVRGNGTSGQTVVSLCTLAKQWGKLPLVVQDRPGFLVHRLMLSLLNEALLLLEAGTSIELIDRTLQRFGMDKGPFQLFDTIGIDVAFKVYRALQAVYSERHPESPLLAKMIRNGRLGKKVGIGFYRYSEKSPGKGRFRRRIYRELDIRPKKPAEAREIQERLLFVTINEAAFCLSEKVIDRPQAVDIAAIFGLGFPPWHGGLLRYADTLGLQEVSRRLEYFAGRFGPRYRPAPLLRELADSQKNFYGKIAENSAVSGKEGS